MWYLLMRTRRFSEGTVLVLPLNLLPSILRVPINKNIQKLPIQLRFRPVHNIKHVCSPDLHRQVCARAAQIRPKPLY